MTDRPPRGTNPGKPSRIDTSTAHSARIYNYWLGGKDNFPADREAAEAAMAANPGIVADVRANRAFLARAVRYLVTEAGVRQFLDIGTGLPTADNTHEVAQAVAPESRIVYVDNDPIVLTHARALLSSTPEGAAAFLDADLREPELILKSAARTLDLGQPVALMLLIILHLIPDAEHPERIVARLMSALPAGSYLVISHPARDVQPAAMAEMTRRVNERMRGAMATLRTRDEVAGLFGGLTMIEPGVVQPQQWRPDPTSETPAEVTAWCGVALKSLCGREGRPMTDTWFSGIFPGSKQSAEIDTTVAHPARVYDYWLGGKDNFAADREAAERVLAVAPGLRFRVKANRAFLARAVRFLATDCGIRQFLDIGTGIPSANNTHEVAQAAAPASRIVYVDNDPIVLAHARALLTSTPEGATAYLEADLREPDVILTAARQTLDFRQPVALMLVGILHLIQDAEEPYQIVSHLVDALPPGSYLIISHPASDIHANQAEVQKRYNERVATPQTLRSHAQVCRFFDGLQLVPPGVVYVHTWRPNPDDEPPTEMVSAHGGIGRKP